MNLFVAPDLSVHVDPLEARKLVVTWGEGSYREQLQVDSPDLVSCLMALPTRTSAAEVVIRLRDRLDIGQDEADAIVRSFVDLGLLSVTEYTERPGETAWLDVEWDDALRFHRASRGMIWSHDYTGDPQVMTRYHVDENVRPDTPPPAPWKPAVHDVVPLPEPILPATAIYSAVMSQRRTRRRFANTSISLLELGTVLGATFAPRFPVDEPAYHSSQTYSRGAPFAAYVIAADGAPNELDSAFGVYHYDACSHTLGHVRNADLITTFGDLLWGQSYGDGAPALLVVCADWPQFTWKYRFSRGYRFVFVEAGAFMQTAITVATALGLSSFATPAVDDNQVALALAVDDARVGPLYVAALGR